MSAQGSSCSFAFASVHSGAHRGLHVHSGSLGFTRARIGVDGFNRFGLGTLARA